MGKKPLYILGTGMACLGLIGTFNAATSIGKAPVEKADLVAEGKITSVNGTELRHRVGVTLSTSYDFNYSFVAEDGKTYSGQDTIDESEFKMLAEGQKVKVRYHSSNPNINASSYGTYVGVEEFPGATPMMRLVVCSGLLLLGAGVLISTQFVVDDEPETSQAPHVAVNSVWEKAC